MSSESGRRCAAAARPPRAFQTSPSSSRPAAGWACRSRRRPAFTADSHGDEHGFLNLLAAAVFDGDEEEALAEEDESAFDVTAEAFTWRERSAGPEEIAGVRQKLFVGFGSCSAQEPIDGLETLGLLPEL